jgi:ferrochelatase
MSKNEKTAIILVNLGTPKKPDASSVKAFLAEFLADQRVIEGKGVRRWLWLAVLNFIVLQTRPKKVAKLYQEIWQDDSPMRNILNQQVHALQADLNANYKEPPTVFAAMTYGEPGLSPLLKALAQQKYQKVFVMPLFPQYSATSTAPVYDKVADFQKSSRNVLDIRILKSYFDHPKFIASLSASIEQHWQKNQPAERLVFSYHGIPQQYADAGDPYPQQCLATTDLVKRDLLANGYLKENEDQSDEQLISTFQSRFGPTKWVEPYTDESLASLAKSGVKSVDIICPAFSADCLETLEEIAQENKKIFTENGGVEYRYIAALNDAPLFIDCLSDILKQQASDWLGEKIEP